MTESFRCPRCGGWAFGSDENGQRLCNSNQQGQPLTTGGKPCGWTEPDLYLRLVSDNEQERAMLRQWWKESSVADKAALWDVMQRKYNDPAMEVMSRFAALAFAEMVEKYRG